MSTKAIFKFTPRLNPDFRETLRGLMKQEDFRKFILENDKHELHVTLERSTDKKEKMKMWAYLHGPVISEYISCKLKAGESIDKADAIWELKCMFLKDTMIDPTTKKEVVYVQSMTDLNKVELFQFIQKVLFHLEIDLGGEVPDAETYLESKVSEDCKRIMWLVK